MYGFELAELLETCTDGVLDLKEGTLYPALHRLEADNLVESFWRESPKGPRRRYYKLTPLGESVFQERRNEWRKLTEAVNGALGI